MRTAILFLSMASLAIAQETAAPTPERAGPVRGETWNGYNIVNSIETGYRFAAVGGGDDAMYRSSVNYGNGIRLLGSYFTMNSKDGRGRWLDSVVITTQGLGNDPYESASLRIVKNRTYHYDMTWRRNDYFNPGLVTGGASGNHLLDAEYDMQDHDLTIFPESNLKFFLGYSGTSQTGAAISSIQPLGGGADTVPLFANVRRVRREYRLGNEFRVLGVRMNWMRGWEDFKDDTPFTGVNFQRVEPYHGTSPYWRAALFADRKIVGVNGHFTYTSGRRAFIVDETAVGPLSVAPRSQQIQTSGDAQRPVATGNLNVVIAPGSKLTIVNSSSVYNVRTSGNSAFTQFDNGTHSFDALFFQYLGIRTFANETDLNYQFSPLLGAFAGYEYSDRRIRSIQFSPQPADQTNILHDGRLGIRLRPAKGLTVLVSAEAGRNNRPFTPAAERNYHALNARVQYRSKDLLLAAGAESDYRFNSVALSSYSSQSRKYFANGSWNPRPWLGFDGSFSRAHLYTIGGIAYFESFPSQLSGSSLYISNLNTLTAGIRFAAAKRADVYVAYVRTRDEGDGRSTNPNLLFQSVQTYPMAFQSPLARLSLRITEKLRWNAGYQYYGYSAQFYANRNFRANTGYTSVTWSF